MNQEELVYQEKKALRQLPRWKKLPEGAVFLNDLEVIGKQYQRIAEWKPRSQVWPFTYGNGMLGGLAGISGFFVTKHYREMLQLGSYARVLTYMPTMLVPTMITMLFHTMLVSHKVLLGRLHCPICLETRSGALQLGFGAVYPMLIGPIICIIQARKFYTYAVPSFGHHKEMFHMLKTTAPINSALVLIFLSNFALGMFVASKESGTFLNVLMRDQLKSRELDTDGFE